MDKDKKQRLDEIEERLATIENYLQMRSSYPKQTKSKQVGSKQAALSSRAIVLEKPIAPGTWLGIIAIICFVLAAGFIIKLSIDTGWLTQVRQVSLSALFGLGLIAAGLLLLRTDKEYAAFLPATGIIVLYLSAFAAHRLYMLISFHAGIELIAFISLICLWLYKIIKHDIYALIAAIGAYLAPTILGASTDSTFTLYYLVMCSITFAIISIWVRSRLLSIVAAYLAILVTASIGTSFHPAQVEMYNILIAILLPVHFLIFSVSTFLYSRVTEQALSEKEAWGFFPVLIIFYATEYHYLMLILPSLAPWISLGFAAVLIGLYLSSVRLFNVSSPYTLEMLIAFTTIVAFHSIYIELLSADARSWLVPIILLAMGFLLPTTVLFEQPQRRYLFPMLAVILILVIEYVLLIENVMIKHDLSTLPVLFASLASIWVLLIYRQDIMNKKQELAMIMLGSAHLLAIVGLYRLTTDYNSLAVSVSWLLYAILVIVIAYSRQDKIMAKSALFVLSFAAAKALLYDAASAPTLVRIFCLLITGLVLYCAGFFFRKIDNWPTSLVDKQDTSPLT